MTFHMLRTDPTEILLVDADSRDARRLAEAFEETEGAARIRTASDGYEALHRLKRGVAESEPLPDLVLADFRLPGKDGRELLEAIRGDPALRCLPVIIMIDADADVEAAVIRCYEAHANACLTKPTDPDEFGSVAAEIERFWLERAQLPPTPNFR